VVAAGSNDNRQWLGGGEAAAAKMCSTVGAAMAGGDNGHHRLMELQPECAWQRRQQWVKRSEALREMLISY